MSEDTTEEITQLRAVVDAARAIDPRHGFSHREVESFCNALDAYDAWSRARVRAAEGVVAIDPSSIQWSSPPSDKAIDRLKVAIERMSIGEFHSSASLANKAGIAQRNVRIALDSLVNSGAGRSVWSVYHTCVEHSVDEIPYNLVIVSEYTCPECGESCSSDNREIRLELDYRHEKNVVFGKEAP